MKENLEKILSGFKDKRVVVWGDIILDEYIFTSTGRISREAPVLITEFESNTFKAGGAGNVVMNVKSMGADPIPVGFIGNDTDGKAVKNILKENSISSDYLIEVEDFKTPKKSRILSGGDNTKKQQVLRIDTLNRSEMKAGFYLEIEKSLLKLLDNKDFLIISDYIYESVKPFILVKVMTKLPGLRVIVDSRNNLLEFENITIATPNEPEFKKIFPGKRFESEDDYFDAGAELMNRVNTKAIVLKRGQKGIIVFEKNKEPEIIKIHGSSEIVDVTGAGDTVISVMGLSLSTGADLLSAAKLANIAAGIVVMKEGAYPVSINELQNELK